MIFFVVTLAIGLRLWRLDLPFFEPYNNVGRQSIGASIARNFYQNGFNFFYPEINENGAGPSLFNLEMQFNSYMAAVGYWLAGGVHEWIARGVSVLFSTGLLFILYYFTKRLYDKKTALWALLFASISPMHLALSRAVQPEETLIFASAGALFGYTLYQETHQKRFFLLSVLCMFVAIGSKLYSVYLFIPLFFLGWQYEGKRIIKNPNTYFYFFLSLSACLWWWAMWRIGQGQDLAYSSYHYKVNRAGEGMNYLEVLFHGPYLKFLGKIFLVHLLTPVGVVFFLAGLFQKIKTKADLFVQVWFWSVALYLLVFWRAAVQHPYYQAPFIPVCAILVGKGAQRILSDPGVGRYFKKPWIALPLILLEIASVFYFYRGLYFIPAKFDSIVEAGLAVQQSTPKDALVVASHGTSAIQLYYCNRKGWSFGMLKGLDRNLIEQLESMREKGADYFVASSLQELKAVPEFENYLRNRYRVVEENPRYVLFDFRPRN